MKSNNLNSAKKKDIKILCLLIILLLIINYPFLDNSLEILLSNGESGIVERVIDGDTIDINGTSVRLLGVNSPEKGEHYYQEAKNFLENLVLNKTVNLEFGKNKMDKYRRMLAYLKIGNKNINLELVKEGFANFYFPSGKDQYYKEFKSAWENCINKNNNLCEKSRDICADCIILQNFNYVNQEVEFYNKCYFNCFLENWTIKDEGRKIFIFPDIVLGSNEKILVKVGNKNNSQDTLYWNEENYVWTLTGDTLFLRDNKGKLILWENY